MRVRVATDARRTPECDWAITREISFSLRSQLEHGGRRCGRMRALEGKPSMLCLGSRIRLTRPEFERLHRITGIAPVGVATRADLDAYVRRCKAHYWGVSKDT